MEFHKIFKSIIAAWYQYNIKYIIYIVQSFLKKF